MTETLDWWPFAVILAGAAATYLWRGLGVALSGRIDPGGRSFEWAACIAYALVAALVARMIVLPTGPLAATPLADRLGTTALSLAVYFLAGRNMLWSVGAGVGALTLLTWGRTAPF
ncbi:MAG: AzlD domain-containing protein [Alphaproteobacteria bacterium]